MNFSELLKSYANSARVSLLALSVTVILALLSTSCQPEEPVFCTQEFRSISVTVNNDSIVSAFVIDQKLKDTLNSNIWNNQCTVADDGVVFNRLKSGEKRNFTLHAMGKRGGKVTGDFQISRDQCHILLVSGPGELSF